jgi:hypothetical protein
MSKTQYSPTSQIEDMISPLSDVESVPMTQDIMEDRGMEIRLCQLVTTALDWVECSAWSCRRFAL